MESRFDADFTDVRVHTDSAAAVSAATIRAHAYTTGHDIVFGTGRYAPETAEGKRLLAHELTHVIQQRDGSAHAIPQRAPDDSAPSAPAPANPNPPPAAAAPADPEKDPVVEEKKSFDAARARVGQPAAIALFSNPNSPSTMNRPEWETFSVADVVDRKAGDPARPGFDDAGPATAYAGIVGGDAGGAVLKQSRFFFVAKLQPGKHKLRVVRAAWWRLWEDNDHVYRVVPGPGVVAVTGMAGFVFPLNKDLEDDPERARFLKNPTMAVPAGADSMRRVAGVGQESPAPAGKVPGSLDEVEIPPERHEDFILGYFRARGLESLAANEKQAADLAQTFKATDSGSETRAPSGVSAEAQEVITADRELAKTYGDLLEQEVRVAALLDFLALCADRGEFPPFWPIPGYTKPQKPQVLAMTAALQQINADIQQRKLGILAASPLIGQLVGIPDPRSRFQTTTVDRVKFPPTAEIPRIYGTNPFRESLLAQPRSPEGDEAIRAAFEKKLDAVRKAIRDARSEMLGDTDFLLGLDGLRSVVERDLSRITGKNAALNQTWETMKRSHAVKDTSREILGVVIQLGLLFVPGGVFLSALAGFAISGAQMAKNLRTWTVSQASVNPATALANQQLAEDALGRSTIDLAINAVFLATEAITGLKTFENAAQDKKLAENIEKIESAEAKAAAGEPPDVAGRALEPGRAAEAPKPMAAGGAADEVPVQIRGESHGLHAGPDGIELCSPKPCGLFVMDVRKRIAKFPAEGAKAEQGKALLKRARANDSEGLKIQKQLEALPPAKVSPSTEADLANQKLRETLEKRLQAVNESDATIAKELEALENEVPAAAAIPSGLEVGRPIPSIEAASDAERKLTRTPMPEGTTKRTYSNGGAVYYVDSSGRTLRAEGLIDPPSVYVKEGAPRTPPAGYESGRDHRGHLIPERGAPIQDIVNLPENVIAEHGSLSNLSAKKRWENRVMKYVEDNPGSKFRSVHEPLYLGNESRPYAVRHTLFKDGVEVKSFNVTIPNPL